MESVGGPIAITTAWVSHIAVADDPWIFTNIGDKVVYARYDDGTPVATERGMPIQPGGGMVSGIHGLGKLWFKCDENYGAIELAK